MQARRAAVHPAFISGAAKSESTVQEVASDPLALVASPLVPDRAARSVPWHRRGRGVANRAKCGSGYDRRFGSDSLSPGRPHFWTLPASWFRDSSVAMVTRSRAEERTREYA